MMTGEHLLDSLRSQFGGPPRDSPPATTPGLASPPVCDGLLVPFPTAPSPPGWGFLFPRSDHPRASEPHHSYLVSDEEGVSRRHAIGVVWSCGRLGGAGPGEGSRASNLQQLTDDDLRVGDPVLSIGSPFGLDPTITARIVGALDRDSLTSPIQRPALDAIQTDAAINPGNSGGALFDDRGEVLRVNTALQNPTGQAVFMAWGYPSRSTRCAGSCRR